MKYRRTTAPLRKAELVAAALHVARKYGYTRVTREAVADRAGCSLGLVSYHFSTMTKLRRAVMSAAVAGKVLEVIAQGLAERDSKALAAPETVRRAALASLM